MAVIKSNIARKYSTIAFFLLFFTKFLIPDPNAAQNDIDTGQIIKAVIDIKKIAIIRSNMRYPTMTAWIWRVCL